jgi:hypothetical protein
LGAWPYDSLKPTTKAQIFPPSWRTLVSRPGCHFATRTNTSKNEKGATDWRLCAPPHDILKLTTKARPEGAKI